MDLKYPEELHNAHKDLPSSPDKEQLRKQWLSDCQQSFLTHSSWAWTLTEKLWTTLYDEANYVLHQRNLRQYLSAGLRIKKIHTVLKFNQSNWLKKYIDFNTQMRTVAKKKKTISTKTDFEKDFYKLMNNAVFDKEMENVRNIQNIRLTTSWKQASKLINRRNFKWVETFSENFFDWWERLGT